MGLATVAAAAMAVDDPPPNPGEAPGVHLAAPRRAVEDHPDNRQGLPDADTSTDRSRNLGAVVPSGQDPGEGAYERGRTC